MGPTLQTWGPVIQTWGLNLLVTLIRLFTRPVGVPHPATPATPPSRQKLIFIQQDRGSMGPFVFRYLFAGTPLGDFYVVCHFVYHTFGIVVTLISCLCVCLFVCSPVCVFACLCVCLLPLVLFIILHTGGLQRPTPNPPADTLPHLKILPTPRNNYIRSDTSERKAGKQDERKR